MNKPFLTIGEQVELLNSRGMQIDNDTYRILQREGYYSIVNGYKDTFIDSAATNKCGDDRYLPGSKFVDMYATFQFDRELRELTFDYLIRAEATAKTAIAYCFSEKHREADAALQKESYCQVNDFRFPERYDTELKDLISRLENSIKNSQSDFIKHYRKHHESIPLWVLVNDLTFGNISHFYNLMKPVERNSACKMIVQATGRNTGVSKYQLTQEKASICLEVLYKFRNKCAHDERLYNARVGGRKSINYVGMLEFLEPFLTQDEFNSLITNLLTLIASHQSKNPTIAKLLNPLGFFELGSIIEKRLSTPIKR
ncbi:MAG: Abi family protein [Atopobium minutum]|uniref:Abi family protein n=1 Tax=Atopobium minutum TaxID=1381 RepID=UPI001DF8DAF1|nr:Abi family protein [Atopobium minutum]MBS4874124.1 Abi family protein [Atopobium minutum]